MWAHIAYHVRLPLSPNYPASKLDRKPELMNTASRKTFRTQNPDSYLKTKTTVKVSDLAYVFGLLDCVGELKRVIMDSLNRTDSDFAKKVFVIMQELFQKLEPFTQFSNSFDYLKPKIDAARYAVNDAKKLLK